ncbi:MAG: hypothetical protein M3O91_04950, partial [Chloroflexota bacterium]|nr:hypothetical protein [Chloroflexota bacterium]
MSRLDERELLAFAAEIAGYQRPSVSSALRARLRDSLMAAPVTPSPGPALAWPRAAALRPVVAAV